MSDNSQDYNSSPYRDIWPVSEAGGSHVGDPEPDENNDQDEDDIMSILASGQDLTDEQKLALEQAAKEIADRLERERQERESIMYTMAAEIEGKLNKRMGTRKSKENQWLEALRIYLGSLSSYNIVTGQYPFGTRNDANVSHRPEFNIIRQKCNIAIAQTVAHQFAAGNKNWCLRTPQVLDIDDHDLQIMIQSSGNPNITPREAADMKTDLMEREIEYHLMLTNYAEENRKALADRVILGTGVMKGPLNTGKLSKKYVKQQTSDGKIIRVPTYSVTNTPLIYRVNLWYWFPDDSVTDISQAEDCIEVHPMNKAQLNELTYHDGYYSDQIEPCLDEEPRTYVNSPFNDPAYLTQGINLLKDKYLVLEYHGPIEKKCLQTLGIQTDDSPLDEQYAEVWVANSRVIRIQTSALEGCTSLPYYACTWEDDPACIPGFGIPMLARDQQRVVNETYKMVLDNAGLSAGPQVVVDTTILTPADGGMECTPFKVWYAKEYGADMTKAIQFFTPPNSFQGLSSLMQMAREFAEEESSINLLSAGGSSPSGQMDSATGLALQNENALTPLFFKSEQWDDRINRPLITGVYDWEMQYNPKEEIKGTVEIDVRTPTAQLRGAMDKRQLDMLFQEIAMPNSPTAKYINIEPLIRCRLNMMRLPSMDIVKTPEQIAKEDQAAAQNPPPPSPDMIKAQAMMQTVSVEKQNADLNAQKFQWEMQQHERDLQAKSDSDHISAMTTMSTNNSKERQAQISASQKQTQLAQSHDAASIGAAVTLHTNMQDNQTKKQLAGLSHAEHVQSLQQDDKHIASQEKQAQQKQEIELRKIRVNSAPHPDQTANRNLTKHNPKP